MVVARGGARQHTHKEGSTKGGSGIREMEGGKEKEGRKATHQLGSHFFGRKMEENGRKKKYLIVKGWGAKGVGGRREEGGGRREEGGGGREEGGGRREEGGGGREEGRRRGDAYCCGVDREEEGTKREKTGGGGGAEEVMGVGIERKWRRKLCGEDAHS